MIPVTAKVESTSHAGKPIRLSGRGTSMKITAKEAIRLIADLQVCLAELEARKSKADLGDAKEGLESDR